MDSESKKVWFVTWQQATLAAVIIALIAGMMVFSNYKTSFLTKLIHTTVAKSSKNLYRIDFDEIQTNLLVGNISLLNVKISSDSTVYQQMLKQKKLPSYVYNIQIPQLDIKHINLFKALFYKSMTIGSMVIDKSIVSVVKQDSLSCSAVKPDMRTAYQHIANYYNVLQVDEIGIHDITLHYTNRPLNYTQSMQVKNVSAAITNFLIDSLSQHDTTRVFFAKDLAFSIQNYKIKTHDKLYTISFDALSGSTGKKTMRLVGFHLVPNYTEGEFSAFKEQQSRYELAVREIIFNSLNYKLLQTRGLLTASVLNMVGADVAIFLNRALPKPKIDRTPNFPTLALKRLPIPINLDTVNFFDTKLKYTEFNPLSARSGSLYFNNINGKLTHVTNNVVALQGNPYCYASAMGLMMGTGIFNINFKFDLVNPKAAFDFSGSLGPMNIRDLNPVLKPLALIKVGKGIIDTISFNGTGNTDFCSGRLTAKYKQLRIGLLARDSTKLKRQMLASLYTSIVILRSENPSADDGLLHTASFLYKRPVEASFVNSLWRGLAMGLMDNIGLGAAVQQELKNRVRTMHQQKIDHKIRRLNRVKRRAEREKIRRGKLLD